DRLHAIAGRWHRAGLLHQPGQDAARLHGAGRARRLAVHADAAVDDSTDDHLVAAADEGAARDPRARLRARRTGTRDRRALHRGADRQSRRRNRRRDQRGRSGGSDAAAARRQHDGHGHRGRGAGGLDGIGGVFGFTSGGVPRRSAGARRAKVKRVVLGLVVVASLLPRLAAAQAVTGTILGTVTDTTNAPVPGATVTLTNLGNGLTRTVTTDSVGEYTAPSLPTGKYRLVADLSGFKTVTIPDIDLGVDQHLRFNVQLSIGAVEENVMVTASSPLVQINTSELGTTVQEEQIKTLPLNGRNFVNLTRTVPGVVRGIPGANIDGAGSLAWRASASFSANGQRPRDNNYMLDGVDNNETWLQTVVIFPIIDALDEFKLQTSTYSAEFGRSLGGVVNLQIKSGTNQMHGSGFEFLRNDAFDANNFFNNRAGRAKPNFSQHQYGGTYGGPIQKDRTFVFFGDQGYKVNQGATYLSTVPSALMRQGDFSEISRALYDPPAGQPFPGNVIPANRINPTSKSILDQLIPESNTGGTRSANGQTINNYLINPTLERLDNQIDTKVDHSLSASNRFFVRYSYQKTHRVL